MPPCLLRLLGTPQIEHATGVLHGGVVQRHRIALLALLTLAPRHLLPRDRLLAFLWPEASPRSARDLLNAAVHAVRRSLGEEVLITDGHGLRLEPARIRVDVLEFEAALKSGDVRRGIELYAGPLLDGFSLPGAVEFDHWQDLERARLERLYHAALEQQAESAYREEGPKAAAEWWRRRLACTPTDARTVIRLMEVLVAAGDRAEAMRAAALHARMMEEEFGAKPDHAVASLADRIHGGAPVAGQLEVSSTWTVADASDRPVESVRRRVFRSHLPPKSPGALARSGIRIAAAVMLSLAVVAALITTSDPPKPNLDTNAIFVAPFRVTSAAPELEILGEGIVDILSAQFTGDAVPRAVDSRAAIYAWKQSVHRHGRDLGEDGFIALAEQFGAGQLLLGELVSTPSGMQANARILSVPDARVLAQHSELATNNELELVNRVVNRLLAEMSGEAEMRLRMLSQSQDAMNAYLAAMHAYRQGRYSEASALFGRAIELDPEFAVAALRRLDAADLTPSARNILEANIVAWRLRDRLSTRDRAILQTGWAIGPNYPLPSTMAERLDALNEAVALNPDRPEAWLRLGTGYLIYGASAGVPDSPMRAVAALDRAIALDSTFTPALQLRLWAALETHDSASVRRIGRLYAQAQSEAPDATVHQWLVARALGDSVSMHSLGKTLHETADVLEMMHLSVRAAVEGFSLSEGYAALLRAVKSERDPTRRDQLALVLVGMAGLRGRAAEAVAWADSLTATGSVAAATYVVTLALADSGYDAAADRAAAFLDAVAAGAPNAAQKANTLCYAELWRSLRGNAAHARRVALEIRQLVRDFDPAPFPRVGRMLVCPLLLEAAAERAGTPVATPALDSLDALMRQGTGLELPGNIANLMVGRWREEQGDRLGALAAVRRRLGGLQNPHFTLLQPALLREEGRLAALSGDTLGAIRAFQHYLIVRDSPDEGPMKRQVESVMEQLGRLDRALADSGRRSRPR